MREPEGVSRKLGICPPHGHSLQVTFPCAPPWAGGFPPKQRLGRPTAPLGPSLRAAAPSRPLGAGRSSDPSWPPYTGFRLPASLPNPFRDSSTSTSRGCCQRPLPPPGRPFPRLQRRVPPRARDAVPFLPRCPPGAAPAPGQSPQQAAASQILPAPPRSRADTV